MENKLCIDVNMLDEPGEVTWLPDGKVLKVKLMNADINLTLDLGEETVRQLKQALDWGPKEQKPWFTS